MSYLTDKRFFVVGATAGIIGFCIWFDHKRRSDPEYKNKIRANRRGAAGVQPISAGDFNVDFTNPAQIQNYFLREMQLGEELLDQGKTEEGAEHLANAIVVCGQPEQILQILQQTLGPAQFAAIVNKIPEVRQRFAQHVQRAVRTNQVVEEEEDVGFVRIPSNQSDVTEDEENVVVPCRMEEEELE